MKPTDMDCKEDIVANGREAVRVHITGLVQGVGFRPFIYRLAIKNKIRGWVENTTDGIHIKAVGEKAMMDGFLGDIQHSAPPAAEINHISIVPAQPNGEKEFVIAPSPPGGEASTEISPDIAVCPDCLADMENQAHRKAYPLINCTNCGPRFSIIKGLPYDRKKTTMARFQMCETCSGEYSNINDRRFHAQPVACNHCGPVYEMFAGSGKQIQSENIAGEAAKLLEEGKTIAIKGSGGFHLVCDAMNPCAVQRLRSGKQREGKPFAVMFSSLEAVRRFAFLGPEEEEALTSWKRPIVLLRSKEKLPPEVNSGLSGLGVMLPYMPFHHLLFQNLATIALVITSGNNAGAPIIANKRLAFKDLKGTFDYLVDYNRAIWNRTDDSVIQWLDNHMQIIRRSRGYVPKPIPLSIDAGSILATGSELKNCFCLGKGNSAIMSPHIGDLKNMETFSFFAESVDRLSRLFHFKPTIIATDLHPDYLTGLYSHEQGLPVEHIQHHHAHIASCMAEHRINETVIGIGLDGTGYGTDGHIWGGEIMRCDLKGFQRLGHFEYMPVPGGDKAVEQPWRMALGCLFKAYDGRIPQRAIQTLRAVDKNQKEMVIRALEENINITLSSGSGRLFDAAASLVGLVHRAGFEAEGPMRLEACADRQTRDFYPTSMNDDGVILVGPMITGIIEDMTKRVRPEVISARFHHSVIAALQNAISRFLNPKVPEKVILSGGVFQNRLLLSGLSEKLRSKGIKVFTNQQVPVNDGGIALGQLVIAAERRNASCA